MGYYNMISSTIILITVLNIHGIYWYFIGGLFLLIIRWFLGFLHNKYFFKEEQEQSAKLNTVLMDMQNKINNILENQNNTINR